MVTVLKISILDPDLLTIDQNGTGQPIYSIIVMVYHFV
jgi:hypothetical protein